MNEKLINDLQVRAGLLQAHRVLGELSRAGLLDLPEEVVGAAGHVLALLDAGPYNEKQLV